MIAQDESPYVTASLLRPFTLGLAAMGLNVEGLADFAGLSLDQLMNPDTRVALSQSFAMLREGVRLSGDEALGLHLAQMYEPGVFGVLDHLAAAAQNLREAIEALCRYERIHQNAMVTTLSVRGEKAFIHHALLHRLNMPRSASDSTLANLVVIGRRLTGIEFNPLEVSFIHPPPRDVTPYTRLFRCPLVWSAPADVMVVAASLLDTPLRLPSPALWAVLGRHADELLTKVPSSAVFSGQVRAHICAALPKGDASIERIAATMGSSPRTVQRRLRDEKTSFGELLEAIRSTLARDYLGRPELGVDDVALLLGFSDARAFRRAFRRWEGQSPAAFRVALRGG